MIAVILATVMEAIEQFGSSFGADVLLLLFLFGTVFLDVILNFVGMIKIRQITAGNIVEGILKLPLYCLYLFLVGVISISLQHSIQIALPIMNVFVAYLVTSEAFSIILRLREMGVKVPALLVTLVTEIRQKVEERFDKKVQAVQNDDNKS